jgi:hypothetical protein
MHLRLSAGADADRAERHVTVAVALGRAQRLAAAERLGPALAE